MDNSDFVALYPSISFLDESLVVVETVTRLDRSFRPEDHFEAVFMVESKMKSADVIRSQLGASCRSVNEEAFAWAWTELASDVAKERFLRRNVTWQFLDDVILGSEEEWLDAELAFDFDGVHLLDSFHSIFSSCSHQL